MLGFLILPQIKPADSNSKYADDESARGDQEYGYEEFEINETVHANCNS